MKKSPEYRPLFFRIAERVPYPSECNRDFEKMICGFYWYMTGGFFFIGMIAFLTLQMPLLLLVFIFCEKAKK